MRRQHARTMSLFADYTQHDGLGLAALVRRGEVSAAELLDTALARIERTTPRCRPWCGCVPNVRVPKGCKGTPTPRLPACPFW
jgi:amidase